jgi:hypothetical protein
MDCMRLASNTHTYSQSGTPVAVFYDVSTGVQPSNVSTYAPPTHSPHPTCGRLREEGDVELQRTAHQNAAAVRLDGKAVDADAGGDWTCSLWSGSVITPNVLARGIQRFSSCTKASCTDFSITRGGWARAASKIDASPLCAPLCALVTVSRLSALNRYFTLFIPQIRENEPKRFFRFRFATFLHRLADCFPNSLSGSANQNQSISSFGLDIHIIIT